MPACAVIFHRFGPYHMRRLQALSRRTSIIGVELCGTDDTYRWEPVGSGTEFPYVTLFPGTDVDKVNPVSVRKHVFQILDELGPRAVFVPGWSHRGALAGLQWCIRMCTPAIVMADSTRADSRRTAPKELLKQRLLRFFGAALVAGTRQKAYLRELGFPEHRIFLGYDVVDNEHFRAGADLARRQAAQIRPWLSLPERYFLAVARFVEKKNLFRLFESYAWYRRMIGRDAWKLVLLGDGELRSDLEAHRARLGLGSAILMPGFKQYDELPFYYGLASAFIHASAVEQWGLVVNEAMAAGLPVLVSERCGCAPDLVRDGFNGFWLDPHDIDVMAKSMCRMAHSDVDRRAMGRASQEIIAEWGLERFSEGALGALRIGMRHTRAPGGPLDQALLWLLQHR
jgi:glycosyltransferase involved in cell wall biosynthesis